jgi:glycosyltransferase involved in cell wall biosynthesis
MASPELFIAIPTWNSALFLEPCLKQIEATCRGVHYQVGVLDNGSTDATVSIARHHGCKVAVHEYALPDALNQLAWWSRSPYTLFIHADTILLNPQWFALCKSKLTGANALLSPQDIGCGPYTRPWGKDRPESSFMLFRTPELRSLRNIRWVRRFRLRLPQRVVNFYSPSVTHYLPAELEKRALSWVPMKVHTSRHLLEPVYSPRPDVRCWAEELGHLEYGLGNFYSVDGVITHYHNWYERQLDNEHVKRKPDEALIPLDYIGQRSRQFLADLASGNVGLPGTDEPEREPKALPVFAAAG